MWKVIITGHRGMGVSNKKRDEFIPFASFYPENSIVGFKEAIKVGADALECDIHVSKDNVPMVIHGDKLAQYARCIKDVINGQEVKGFNRTNGEFSGDLKCSNFTSFEIQQYFILKSSDNSRVPTLEELLALLSSVNTERASREEELLILNIELKGINSSFTTLATLAKFNEQQRANSKRTITAEEIVLLGKVEVGEIAIAKNLLRWSSKLFPATDTKLINNLDEVFNSKEIEIFHKLKNNIYVCPHKLIEEEVNGLSDNSIVLEKVRDNLYNVYLVKKNDFTKCDVHKAGFEKTITEFAKLRDCVGLVKDDDETYKICTTITELIKIAEGTNNVSRFNEVILKCNFHDAINGFVMKLLKPDGKKIENVLGKISRLLSNIIDKISELDFPSNLEKIAHALEFNLTDIGLVTNYTVAYSIISKMIEANVFTREMRETEQKCESGAIKARIEDYLKFQFEKEKLLSGQTVGFNKCAHWRNFITKISCLHLIPTNVMLSTGDLHGASALIGNNDFDVIPDAKSIYFNGCNLVLHCFAQGYNGIDASLFDLNDSILEAITKGKQLLTEKEVAIVGVTASNWKGSVKERSPVSPIDAIKRAVQSAERLNIKILLKVDEPDFFCFLCKLIMENKLRKTRSHFVECYNVDNAVYRRFGEYRNRGYDLSSSTPVERCLATTYKPPRDDVKEPGLRSDRRGVGVTFPYDSPINKSYDCSPSGVAPFNSPNTYTNAHENNDFDDDDAAALRKQTSRRLDFS